MNKKTLTKLEFYKITELLMSHHTGWAAQMPQSQAFYRSDED